MEYSIGVYSPQTEIIPHDSEVIGAYCHEGLPDDVDESNHYGAWGGIINIVGKRVGVNGLRNMNVHTGRAAYAIMSIYKPNVNLCSLATGI